MTSAAQTSGGLIVQDGAFDESEGSKLARFAGLMFAALFPACVWMTIASKVTEVVGYELDLVALVWLGAAVALVMVSACAPIMLRD